jgi:hypothetical protein
VEKTMKKFFETVILLLAAILLTSVTALADVNIFAEGAYTTDDLVIYIYADTTVNTPTELRSAGVKLTYNPAELTNPSAEKNETDWYLGSESYMEPDTSTEGEVVIILGKLDPGEPAQGVAAGARVLLGKVTFDRSGTTTDFGLVLDYGKRGDESPPGSGMYSFKNFVDTENPANALDDTAVSFGAITVAERGDANADGNISMSDVMLAKAMYQSGDDYRCYADANGDGSISMSDVMLIKQIYQTGN